jgi:putative N6-adenine-specific DNA methylase
VVGPDGWSLRYFFPCAIGLEEVLCEEVRALGGKHCTTQPGGVSAEGDQVFGYRCCLWLRTAIRVQEELGYGRANGPDGLYQAVFAMPWERWLSPEHTFAIFASVRDTQVRNSKYAGQVAKDAIVDRLRREFGARPSVNPKDPDVPIKLVLIEGRAILYRDLAGESLHRRGWRPIQVKSPLNEAVAAGLLQLSGWDRQSPLVDPMCGSGTFLVEAAHLAGDRAPGLRRAFACERWPDPDALAWRKLRNEAEKRWKKGRSSIPPLEGADRHAGALRIARDAMQRAEVRVRTSTRDIADFKPDHAADTAVVNPPWGTRIGEGEELREAWYGLGGWFRAHLRGGAGWVLSGNAELTRHLGLRAQQKHPIRVGPVQARWICYPMKR